MKEAVRPLQPGLERFFNVEAIEKVENSRLELSPANVNADLQLQERLRIMIRSGIIGGDTFVLVTHGHFIAGMSELSKATTPDGKGYFFDTTVYFPGGDWLPGSKPAERAANIQFQLWSESVRRAKQEHREKEREWAGGMAVGLFGHRDDWDLRRFIPQKRDYARARVDPDRLLGKPADLKAFLKGHHLRKVVIVTEEHALHPRQITPLPLDRLETGDFGESNEDLLSYFEELSGLQVPVLVVSGDMRPPVSPADKKRTEEDKKIQPLNKEEKEPAGGLEELFENGDVRQTMPFLVRPDRIHDLAEDFPQVREMAIKAGHPAGKALLVPTTTLLPGALETQPLKLFVEEPFESIVRENLTNATPGSAELVDDPRLAEFVIGSKGFVEKMKIEHPSFIPRKVFLVVHQTETARRITAELLFNLESWLAAQECPEEGWTFELDDNFQDQRAVRIAA